GVCRAVAQGALSSLWCRILSERTGPGVVACSAMQMLLPVAFDEASWDPLRWEPPRDLQRRPVLSTTRMRVSIVHVGDSNTSTTGAPGTGLPGRFPTGV